MNKTKHLYIHIPFCKSICTYCNFKKEILDSTRSEKYVNMICNEIENIDLKLETIYIGGGTPNCLPNKQLEKILKLLSTKMSVDCEFTIEINPESVNNKQINLFKKYGVNRFSVGIQILNNDILKLLNRRHTREITEKAIELLKNNGLNNISCDFIYNLPLMSFKDIDDIIDFVNEKEIKHLSFYSLEIKEGSILEKQNYRIDEDIEEEFMEYIEHSLMTKTKMKRYEISNWTISDKYKSKHNLCYWNMNDWIGIGYGATGYENKILYSIDGNALEWKKNIAHETIEEYYRTIIIMGLRKTEGIDLSIERNRKAYEFFKDKLNNNLYIIKDNYLKAKNVDLLNCLLIDLY